MTLFVIANLELRPRDEDTYLVIYCTQHILTFFIGFKYFFNVIVKHLTF